MKKRLAKIISILFHPAIFFILMPYLLLERSGSFADAWHWEIFSSLFVFLIVALIALCVKRGIFTDDDVSLRSERYEFYYISLVLAFCYFFIAFILQGMLFSLSIVSLALIVGVVIAAYCNRYMKVSMHVGVASAFIGSVTLLYGIGWLLLTLFIMPLLLWARVYLHKHTPKELFVGALLGVGITLMTFIIGKYIL